MRNKYKGMLYGLVLGDMLGVPYEFTSRFIMKENPCTDFTIGGYHDQPIYSWSDDTSLNLALIDSLLNNNLEINENDILSKYKDWFHKEKYTSHGVVFDIGCGTRTAISNNLIDQSEFKGNGGIIRSIGVLPLNNGRAIENVSRVCNILNNNSTCREINENLVTLVYVFLNNAKCIDDIKDYIRLTSYKYILDMKESDVKSSGYIVDTFVSSIWCLLNTTSFKDAIMTAVNLGDDTDSVAALTGALAGYYYGFEGIPNEWKDRHLSNPELILIEKYLYKIFG